MLISNSFTPSFSNSKKIEFSTDPKSYTEFEEEQKESQTDLLEGLSLTVSEMGKSDHHQVSKNVNVPNLAL